ncbi:hypothetical protein HA47_08190 [Pantoea stewartii subsp. indologenes]|nr:hypothetical protein HA47_08190 [Pantoea stewartii subsp. indologenes]
MFWRGEFPEGALLSRQYFAIPRWVKCRNAEKGPRFHCRAGPRCRAGIAFIPQPDRERHNEGDRAQT